MKLRRVSLLLLCCAAACVAAEARRQTPKQPRAQAAAADARERDLYRVQLALDFDARTFAGTSRVRWTNRDTRSESVLYFHLYANVRGAASDATNGAPSAAAAASPAPEDSEPRVEIKAVRARFGSATAAPAQFALEERATVLRVPLREPVAPGASVEIEIDFAGRVPELDADETSLPAHVIQQLGAALRDTREVRGARDSNFSARGVMLLGASYPLLAVREGAEWRRGARAGVGDLIYAEAADYDVEVRAARDVALYASGRFAGEVGGLTPTDPRPSTERRFVGENLRSFAIVAGRNLQSAERAAGKVTVRSVYARDHEKTGRRVLEVAARAVEIFTSRFGPAPYPLMTVSEAPLSAGVGSAEFTGLCAIASAYYVDFDSPAVRNLPELVREQRSSVEDSLEFAVAHMIAHQWWAGAVGSDPARDPVLDEALAHWSALVYYREAHGAVRADAASEDQLKGVYEIYRTFGGEDLPADREAREYRNSFQYAAVVAAKGALAFAALERLLGPERVSKALRGYHEANRFEVAEMDDLRAALVAEATVQERRAVTRTLARWFSQRHGDEDISPPNAQLAADLGLAAERGPAAANPGNRFSRLGKFFWRQMTRIR